MDSVRIDRWLCAARIFKSRTMATDACNGGHVKLNGGNVKPHHAVGVGDSLVVQRTRRTLILEIVALADKRQSPAQARELYEDHSPPPEPRAPRAPDVGARDAGSGRGTKRDRRHLRRLRGR